MGTEGGRSIHEIDKIRKRLEAEKMELEAALSEAEGALEQEENKVLRIQLELTQVKQEIANKISQKEEEFASTKKNFGKALEGMQMALESETKGKVEALRMKKKLETDVIDLGTALEHANAANAESQKNIKMIQQKLRDVQAKFEEETRAKSAAQDNLIAADRRCNANQNALEEARTLLEQADRNRRLIEQELADTNETLSDQTCQNQAISGAKSKCEQEMNTLGHDLDEMTAEASMSENKAQQAMVDAARLADELRGDRRLQWVLREIKNFWRLRLRMLRTVLMKQNKMLSREAKRQLQRWILESVNLNRNMMLKAGAWLMHRKIYADLSVMSRSWPTLRRRTGKTMNECKV